MIEKLIHRIRGAKWQTPAAWALAFAVAYIHTAVMLAVPYNAHTAQWLFPLIMVLPGIATMVLLRGGFARWYRWAAILGLLLTTYADSTQVVLIVAETWALHRQWITETPGGIRANLRWTPPKPDPAAPVAVKKLSGKFRKPKTA